MRESMYRKCSKLSRRQYIYIYTLDAPMGAKAPISLDVRTTASEVVLKRTNSEHKAQSSVESQSPRFLS